MDGTPLRTHTPGAIVIWCVPFWPTLGLQGKHCKSCGILAHVLYKQLNNEGLIRTFDEASDDATRVFLKREVLQALASTQHIVGTH